MHTNVTGSIAYLDNAASTPCDPRVAQVVVDHLLHTPGNAGVRSHSYGRDAARAIEVARTHVARLVAGSMLDTALVVFTSGATEANNLALLGIAANASPTRRRIVTTSVEHSSVLAPLAMLDERDFEIVHCPVDASGTVDVAACARLIDETTLLVSIQAANNELGTLQPVDSVASIARSAGALVHCDAAQAAGKVPIDLGVLDLDALTISGHKFHGPNGVGALIIRDSLLPKITPVIAGGGQEHGLRPGTHDVPNIAGLGEAARIAAVGLEGELRRIATLRILLEDLLLESIPGSRINGAGAPRVPGIVSCTLPSSSAALVLGIATDVAASTGSACSGGAPSHVLRAIGMDDATASRTMRLALGRMTSEDDVRHAARSIASAWQRVAPT